MSLQAMFNCEQRVSILLYTYRDYYPLPSTNRLDFNFNSKGRNLGPDEVRCNILWTIKTLGKRLILQDSSPGRGFTTSVGGNLLYWGRFGQQMDWNSLSDAGSNQTVDPVTSLKNQRLEESFHYLNNSGIFQNKLSSRYSIYRVPSSTQCYLCFSTREPIKPGSTRL